MGRPVLSSEDDEWIVIGEAYGMKACKCDAEKLALEVERRMGAPMDLDGPMKSQCADDISSPTDGDSMSE